jgi:hypothetical protein
MRTRFQVPDTRPSLESKEHNYSSLRLILLEVKNIPQTRSVSLLVSLETLLITHLPQEIVLINFASLSTCLFIST